MILLGPIGGAAVVAAGGVVRSGAPAECVSTAPAPVGAICLFFLLLGAYAWWFVEWVNWGSDKNHVRVGTLVAVAPLLFLLIWGALVGRYA